MTSAQPVAVVGVDFSDNSESALRFAVEFAETFDGSVVAAHAWSYPWWMATPIGAMASPGSETSEVRSDAKRRLAELVDTIETDVDITVRVVEGSPAEILSDLSASADLVVLGAHAGKLTSSTAHKLAGEVECPIAVVPEAFRPNDQRSIVVGMDGSDDSVDAFRWALDHAKNRDVTALRVWNVTATGAVAPVNFDRSIWSDSTRCALENAVSEALEGVETETEVNRVVDTGDARTVIRRRAEQASMLVIGARGHGAVSHFLLGSVAASMTAHPPCPTVIVPVTED